MAHQTDSVTIHDVITFLQGFDTNDRFLTVIEKEDGFNYICTLILPLVFRHACQSKLSPQGNSLPRIQRIQEIVVLEGIFPELSSRKHATASKGPLSSEQKTMPDPNMILEDPQSSDKSRMPVQNESPQHDTTLEGSRSSERSSAPDRDETHESTSPQQHTLVIHNASCVNSSSLPADGSSPAASSSETVPFQDSAIELSDNKLEKNCLSLRNSQAALQGQITSGDPGTETNGIPITKQDKERTLDYTTLASTIKISLNFSLWSNSPESFWNDSRGALNPKDYRLITNPRIFVKDALEKKSQLDAKTLQNRFYSILIYKIYEILISSPQIRSTLVKQFLDSLSLPSDSTSQLFCSRFLHGGRRRKEFCQRVAPNGHEPDYGVLLIPELDDMTWEQSTTRVRDRCNAIVDLFKAQNIFLWSERSGARSAANSIIFSRQPLLDHFQTQYDNIQGQKRRFEFTEGLSFKRI
ncbi:hypothetical protein TGAM01_v202954 [Trichoderma gamsii]|uniref:Uncharacterized protein n=1 Tax=Trichoderma gamsii TaxID=398673 RepID=A0A2P4ZW04_9HYPO|nr:hypothetical protein TGAM01_v202954 [Trichoderma gamsii]PON28460.1 hypothetical protein TGAM01_v202954 [Trichoderma gamsii]